MLENLRRSPDRLAALASYARLAARPAHRCPDWRVIDTHVLGTSYLAVGHLD